MSLNRPIGFGSLWGSTPAPAAPAPSAPAPKPQPPAAPAPAPDTVAIGGLKGDRFRGDATLASVAAGGSTLTKGAIGPAVKKVQDALQAMAFVMPSGVDGRFGPETAQAVKNFQSAAKLPTTGVVDSATMKALDRFAPAAGRTAWDKGAAHELVPSPAVGKKKARVVVDISQHRAFLYDKAGNLTKIYGVRTGRTDKGWGTVAGTKIVDGKNNDPRAISRALWPESGDKAFGTRLINLSDYDPKTGKTYLGKHKGQELHGTYDTLSIGRDYSHGCVGLTNKDIEEIFDQVGNGELVKFVE